MEECHTLHSLCTFCGMDHKNWHLLLSSSSSIAITDEDYFCTNSHNVVVYLIIYNPLGDSNPYIIGKFI